MIADPRFSTVHPGKLADFVELYEDFAGLPQKKHLGDHRGGYTTVEGTRSIFVNLWCD